MNINELMINNCVFVNTEEDIFPARITKLTKSDIIEVSRYDTGEVIETTIEKCSPCPIPLRILTNSLKFTKRSGISENELILILEIPNTKDFYSVILGDEVNGSRSIKIYDSKFSEILTSSVKNVHQIQNFVKIVTNLEIHISI